MRIINREILESVKKKLQPNKVIIISGARRVGKTFLLKELLKQITEPYILLNGDDINTHTILERRSIENYKQIIGKKRILVIDEAQKIQDIGKSIKLMIDEIEGLKVILTGSSAFDISNLAGEPLTGRKYNFNLYALSEREYFQVEDPIYKYDHLRFRLVFGNYPELVHIPEIEDKRDYLHEIINSYLLKDILIYDNIRNAQKIYNLLRLIAFQLGNEISYHELAKQLNISKNTVEKYLDLLARVFVLFKVEGFSRNLRKEITKSPRWYFYDIGIRNAVIANFTSIENRNDIGQLWENYMISERLKYQQYQHIYSNNYFWRTYDQQEIDWVEERDGKLYGYEFKWKKSKISPPKKWFNGYPEASFDVINSENYLGWIS